MHNTGGALNRTGGAPYMTVGALRRLVARQTALVVNQPCRLGNVNTSHPFGARRHTNCGVTNIFLSRIYTGVYVVIA